MIRQINEIRVLDHERVQLRGLVDGRNGGSSEMLFFVFTSDGVLVAEDEVNLREMVSMCGDTCNGRL